MTTRLMPWRSQRELNTHLLGDSGITIEMLEAKGFHQVSSDPVPASRPFPTGTGRIELFSPELEELGLDPLPGYVAPERDGEGCRRPLALSAGRRHWRS